MDRNNAGDDFGIEMGQTISANQTLRVLDLSENDIKATGVVALARAMCGNTSITVLKLSHNSIGNEGATHLSKMLKVNQTLKVRPDGFGPVNNNLGEGGCLSSLMRIRDERREERREIVCTRPRLSCAWPRCGPCVAHGPEKIY